MARLGLDARQAGVDSAPLHPHRTWSRDKSIEVKTNQMKPTDQNQGPDADKYPLTPTMAVQWQFLMIHFVLFTSPRF
eukprot:SAG25_NODE_9398_length_374_cov_0.698182_1_plen_76_part_01